MIVVEAIRESFRRNPLLAAVAAANLMLALILVPLIIADPMQILGISRWIKPTKFSLSIAIFTATMAWLLWYLGPGSRAVRWISAVIAVTMTGEIALIVMQSFRGVQSHFNHNTPFDNAVFSAMGLLIIANTVAVAYALYLFIRRPSLTSGAHLTGIRLGLLLFVLAGFEGSLMVALDRHSIGIHDGGPGLPFVNWSTGAGDLRVAHFVGMHALQGLPILGWILDRRRAQHGVRWVAICAIAWGALTGLLVVQALAGRPLIALAR